MRSAGTPRPEALAAYVDGEVTPSEAAAIEAALADSPRLRREVEEMRAIRATLARPLPELESIDVVGRVEGAIARGEGAPQPRSSVRARWQQPHGQQRRSRAWVAAAGFAAAAAAVSLMLLARAPAGDEFRVKAAAPATLAAESQRWAGVQVFRASADSAAPELLGARLGAREGLLFAYTNLGPRPFGFLMVFAIDARGEIRWYYPAYERAGTNPTSVPLRGGVARSVLPDVIRQDLAPGALEIRALFTHEPLSVAEVEAWIAAHAGSGALPPWPGGFEQVIATRVVEGPVR